MKRSRVVRKRRRRRLRFCHSPEVGRRDAQKSIRGQFTLSDYSVELTMPAKPRPDRLLKTLAQRVLAAPEARDAFAFQEQLAESQWYGRLVIDAYQLGHLKALTRHAAREVPYYRDALPLAKIDNAATLAEALSCIPILPRDRLAADPDAFRTAALP